MGQSLWIASNSHLHHVSTFVYLNTFVLQWIIICGNMKSLWAARRRSPTCADRGFCIKSVFLIEYLIGCLRSRKLCQSCRCARKKPVLPRCDNHACAKLNQYSPIMGHTRIAHIQKKISNSFFASREMRAAPVRGNSTYRDPRFGAPQLRLARISSFGPPVVGQSDEEMWMKFGARRFRSSMQIPGALSISAKCIHNQSCQN